MARNGENSLPVQEEEGKLSVLEPIGVDVPRVGVRPAQDLDLHGSWCELCRSVVFHRRYPQGLSPKGNGMGQATGARTQVVTLHSTWCKICQTYRLHRPKNR